jgi:hypothetical protein
MDRSSSLSDYSDTEVIEQAATEVATPDALRTDRRRPSLKSFVYGAFNPRRRGFRREHDANFGFLDWHPRHLLAIATLVMLLSVVDGLFTVYLIGSGLQELNPILAPLIHGDPVAFALIKIALTAVGVVTLVITAHARLWCGIPVAGIFYLMLIVYSGVIVYELYLVQFV